MSIDKDWLKRAADIVGSDGVLVEEADLEAYGHDEYALQIYLQIPKAVVRPSTEQQVAEIVKLCAQTGVPITARGGGTGLAAACVPDAESIVLSLERLNKVVEADPANYALTVQAGVTLDQINAAAEEIGLVNRVVAVEDIDQVVNEMAQKLARGPKKAMAAAKNAVYQGLTGDMAFNLDLEVKAQVNAIRSGEFAEGALAFSQRREPDFRKI